MTNQNGNLPRWQLFDLYRSSDDLAIEKSCQWLIIAGEQFQKKYQTRVGQLTATALEEALETLEALLAELNKLYQYSSLLLATETNNDGYKALEMKIRELAARIENQLVFFDLELGALPGEQLQQLMAAVELQPYRHYLQRRSETARYHLTEKEEKIINLKKITGLSAMQSLYEELTADFQFEMDDGQGRRHFTGEELRQLRQHENPQIRQQAMELFLQRYADNRLVINHLYNQIVKEMSIEQQLRGYAEPITVRNVENDLDDALVEMIHQLTASHYHLVQRYYRIKARVLQLPELALHDIYAPLPETNRNFTWDQTQQLVLMAFQKFSPEWQAGAEQMLAEKRVDVPAVPFKRGGAFCSSSIPAIKPYILLNFTGKWRDVSTLAHEMGHAMHSLASGGQTLLNFHATLPLAETASIFAEMLLTESVVQAEPDGVYRQYLLATKIEEIIATTFRQNVFSCFEKKAHAVIGRQLTAADNLCQLYREEVAKMFGDSVVIPKAYDWEWMAIPHIFETPFYVYSYNFANLLVIALYQQYLEEGCEFVPKFLKILSSGSSLSPVQILAAAGIDVLRPEFWKKSFTWIENLIQRYEALIDKK